MSAISMALWCAATKGRQSYGAVRQFPGDANELYCGAHRLYKPNGDLLPHNETPMAEAMRSGASFRNFEIQVEQPSGKRALSKPRTLRGGGPLFTRAVAVAERMLGQENTLTGIGLANLALLDQQQRRYAKATLLYEKALAS